MQINDWRDGQNIADALALIEEHKYAEAYDRLQAVDVTKQDRSEYDFYMGLCCKFLGETDLGKAKEGFAHLARARGALDPNVKGLRYMQIIDCMATTAWILNRIEDARALFEEGLPFLHWYRHPNKPRPNDEYNFHIRLSEVYLRLERHKDAVGAQNQALPLVSSVEYGEEYASDYKYRLGRLLHYNDEDDAALQLLNEVAPEHLDLKSLMSFYFILLRIYDSRDEYQNAWHTFTQFEKVGVEDAYKAHTYFYVGKALYHLGQFLEAGRMFENALTSPTRFKWIHERSREYLAEIRLGHN